MTIDLRDLRIAELEAQSAQGNAEIAESGGTPEPGWPFPLPRPSTLEEAHALILELWREVIQMRGEMAALRAEVAELKAALEKPRKDYKNSSIPPSADVTGSADSGASTDSEDPTGAMPRKERRHHATSQGAAASPTRVQRHPIECSVRILHLKG